MCGICGRLSLAGPASSADLAAALDVLRPRGPDDRGAAEDGPVAVAQTRLAIRGGAAARQPCRLDDGQGLLVYNGEIYNTPELSAELGDAALEDAGDTPVLARWLARTKRLDRIEGIFAFAWWQPARRRLLLVRDRFGVKPLYYAALPDGVAFASSPRAIAALPGFTAAPDPGEVWHALVATPRQDGPTAWRGVRSVPPGCAVCVDAATGRVEVERYARPWIPECFASEEEHAEALAAALSSAVRRQLVSDRPVCLSLSGGLDSSLVAAIASRLGVRPAAFTAGWDEDAEVSSDCFSGSDAAAASQVARHLALSSHPVVVSSQFDEGRVARCVRSRSHPLSHTTELALDDLYRSIAAAGYVVALTGEGADELWHGYSFFERPAGDVVPWASVSLADVSDVLSHEILERESVRERLRDEARRHAAMPLADAVVASFLPYLLERLDAFSMAHSVEARVPFLDEALLRLSFSSARYEGRRHKSVLRRVAAGLLPPEIAHRAKSAFPASRGTESWTSTLRVLRSRVESGRCRIAHWLRRDWMAALDTKRDFPGRVLAWRLLNLDLWIESLDDGAARPAAQEAAA